MNIILLSGGSGKRLWPLSNDIRSKQFIKIFRREDGTYESMVQRVYRGIRDALGEVPVTIATSLAQISTLKNQLGEGVSISAEPCRRDTFPAMALAAAYLHDAQKVGSDEVIVTCPIDPYVDDDYFAALGALAAEAEKGTASLVLMGIEPTYPSAKYGYIIPRTKDTVSRVDSFREKPDEKTAAEYIAHGALWNGGVFACRLGYLLAKAKDGLGSSSLAALRANYSALTKISFDYAVVEKEPSLAVMRFAGQWKDLGTWNTLSEAMTEPVIGQAVLAGTCQNVHAINELDMPILCMGLKNAVVSASPQGIIVADKKESSYIKPLVEKFDNPIMFAEKSWGSFQIIDIEEASLTIKVTLNPGHRMNYHSHAHRREVWTVVSGRGIAVVDGARRAVAAADVIELPIGAKHTIIAEDEALRVIEVQCGQDISAEDKIKHELTSN